MSDTPFTDSRTYGFTDEDGVHCEAIHADFSRKLERERNELRAAVRAVLAEPYLLDPGCAEDQALVDKLKELVP